MFTLSNITNYTVLYFIRAICMISILIFPINQNQSAIIRFFQLILSIILFLCDMLVGGDGLHFNITCILCDVWYVFYPHVTNIQYHKKLPNQFESLFDKSQQLSRILKFTYLKLHPNYGYSLNFTQKSPVFYSQNIELSQNHPFAHFQSIIQKQKMSRNTYKKHAYKLILSNSILLPNENK